MILKIWKSLIFWLCLFVGIPGDSAVYCSGRRESQYSLDIERLLK